MAPDPDAFRRFLTASLRRVRAMPTQAHLYVKREKIAHYGLSFCSNDHFYVLTITNYLTSVNDNIN